MKVIKKSNKEKLYSIRLDEDQFKMIKILKENGINLPEMLRKFIEEVYDQNMNDDKDDLYITRHL